MNIIEILSILMIHYVCDFILQTDWQAKNKSTNNYALLEHTGLYSVLWFIPALIYFFVKVNDDNADHTVLIILFPIITFICHTITDYFTSRLNTKLWKEGKVHWFFVSVGGDQMLHYIQLFITYQLLK